MDPLATWTSLPNLHPALVHFPIAFVVLALCFEVGATFRGRREWLEKAALSTWTAAGLGAWAAWWAGKRAADSLAVPPSVQGHLNTHADWGQYALWAVGTVAVLRLAVGLWRPPAAGGRVWPALFLVAGLVAAGVVLRTADLGGALVYRHGLAVGLAPTTGAADEHETPVTPAADEPGREEDRSDLEVRGDGGWTWRAGASGGDAFTSVLTSREAGPPPGLSAAAAASGLALEVDGSGFALFAEPCGDAQVEADVAFEGFEGTFGLAHHVGDDSPAGLFTVTLPGGRAELGTLVGGDLESMDTAAAEIGGESLTLAVSAAGKHFRGLIDGALVTHGHRSAMADGRCGLFYDGLGTVYLTELRVFPIQ